MRDPTPIPVAETSNHECCLVIRDLTVAYQRKVVLKDVQADIQRGQVVGIIGPNGGGKTTLLKGILGIAPVVRGEVSLFGRPISEMRSHIAYVPQREVVDWDFPVRVYDVAMMGRYRHTRWRRSRAGETAKRLNGCSRVSVCWTSATRRSASSRAASSSGSFIARALAQEADVLLLDEPMNGIDAATQEVIMRIIEEQGAAGKIVLLATHDLASASCTCDCLCCVNERMVSYGPVAETYTADNLSATYGGPVIMLGRADSDERAHTQPSARHPHQTQSRTNLGDDQT